MVKATVIAMAMVFGLTGAAIAGSASQCLATSVDEVSNQCGYTVEVSWTVGNTWHRTNLAGGDTETLYGISVSPSVIACDHGSTAYSGGRPIGCR